MPLTFLKMVGLVFRERSARRRAWGESSTVGDRKLSPFQSAALGAIRRELGELAFCEEGERDAYLVARRVNLTIYVYRDGAALRTGSLDLRFERWDYDSPTRLIEDLVKSTRDIERT